MNKSELVASISEKSELSKVDSERALEAFCASVTGELGVGGTVSLVGFGTFSVKDRAERKGRNPQTGAEITIKASKAPAFKAGKGLKEAVNV